MLSREEHTQRQDDLLTFLCTCLYAGECVMSAPCLDGHTEVMDHLCLMQGTLRFCSILSWHFASTLAVLSNLILQDAAIEHYQAFIKGAQCLQSLDSELKQVRSLCSIWPLPSVCPWQLHFRRCFSGQQPAKLCPADRSPSPASMRWHAASP